MGKDMKNKKQRDWWKINNLGIRSEGLPEIMLMKAIKIKES